MRSKALLQTVADAVADRRHIDWSAAGSSGLSPTQRLLLAQLKRISEASPPTAPTDERRSQSRWFSPWLLGAIIAVAAVKAMAAAVACASAMVLGHGEVSWGPFACLLVFGGSAVALLAGGATDVRTRSLGALFLVIASSFADPPLRAILPALQPFMQGLQHVPADAFLAFTFWRFAVAFPSFPLTRSARRVATVMLAVTLVSGAVLFLANVALLIGPESRLVHGLPFTVQLNRQLPEGNFWMLSFGLTIVGVPYLLWKSRFDASIERHRAAMFAGSLATSFTPMLIVVLLTPFISLLRQPRTREFVSVILYASLLAAIPLTVYSVRVHGVLKLKAIISKALQLTAVRVAVWSACLAPLLLLAGYLYLNRDLTISAIALNDGALAVLAMPVLAALALTFRQPLLRAIDRRVLGDSLHLVDVVARVEHGLQQSNGVIDATSVLVREIDRAVHAEPLAVLVLEHGAQALVCPNRTVTSLPMDSTLANLLRVAQEGIHVGSDASGPVGRLLSDFERRWLVENRIQLLIPLLGTDGGLLGAVVVGQKRNQSAFSREDRMALGIIASRGAVVIENWLLRAAQSAPSPHHGVGNASGVVWTDEPGACCETCSTMWPARTARCACGGATASASVPFFVSGKFRVQRLLGSGGMAVVYLAIDLTLDRRVVVKALPRLTAKRRLRLQHEARAMAAVSHPNLGTIFSVESWRGAPLLVMEFLEGGTLSSLLTERLLSVGEVLELGIALTDLLDRVHAAGILHRDIKPSNIGYTRDGVPKLFDFGVAQIRERAAHTETVNEPQPIDAASTLRSFHGPGTAVRTTADRIMGTPLYLSPEILAGTEASPASDLWSLSVVLFEALTGGHPFAAPTVMRALDNIRAAVVPDVRALRPDCPVALADLFGRALSTDVQRRAASAAELRNWLRRILAELRHSGSDIVTSRVPYSPYPQGSLRS